jgi:N-acetylmuramoyl-L-alanine amidase
MAIVQRLPPLRFLLALLSLALLTVGWAQERHNFLAINGAIDDAAGPYYFIAQGDSHNAFMRAAPFARAAGLNVAYDGTRRELTLSAGIRTVVIDTTVDIAEGLRRQPNAVRYDGGALESPLAIVINGATYLPITPIVAALGGHSDWFPGPQVITIDLPDPTAGVQLDPPRIGVTDGVTRVAIDLPKGHPYQLAVNGGTLAILLPGANAPPYALRLDEDPNLRDIAFGLLDGVVALVVNTRHPLDPNGVGYRLGIVPRDQRDTLYIDFAPVVRGQMATPMRDGVTAPPSTGAQPAAAAPATPAVDPLARRYTVVLDAGHGGRDPGAITAWAVEKEVVLAVALMVKARLEAAGVEVIMVRSDDTFFTLQERSTYATTDRNIFVSIHANGADNRNASGIETFIFGRSLDPTLLARAIAENGGGEIGAARTAEASRIADDAVGDVVRESQLNYSRTLAELVQAQLVAATGAIDRGVKQGPFYVIRNSRIPSILVELGFITHAEEGRRLAQRDHQTKLANALAAAILDFLENGALLVTQ